MPKEEITTVEEVVDNDVESVATEISEDETLQEVEPDETTDEAVEEVETVVEETKDESKLEEQISNLNTALRNERESKREDAEKRDALQARIDELSAVEEEVKTEADTEMSVSDIEAIVEARLAEKDNQQLVTQQAQTAQKQIKELVAEYDGKDGKPLYDDGEVFKWQVDNNLKNLTPKDAFDVMKRKELVEYEVTKRLAGKKVIPKVVKPSSGKDQHTAKKTSNEGVVSDEDMAIEIQQALRDATSEL